VIRQYVLAFMDAAIYVLHFEEVKTYQTSYSIVLNPAFGFYRVLHTHIHIWMDG
jgi:hypothetical protein